MVGRVMLSQATAPCLVFRGVFDPACRIEFGEKLAVSLGAPEVVRLDCNHWPVLQRPAEVAEAIESHWSTGRSAGQAVSPDDGGSG